MLLVCVSCVSTAIPNVDRMMKTIEDKFTEKKKMLNECDKKATVVRLVLIGVVFPVSAPSIRTFAPVGNEVTFREPLPLCPAAATAAAKIEQIAITKTNSRRPSYRSRAFKLFVDFM